jgi:hypothetical protein
MDARVSIPSIRTQPGQGWVLCILSPCTMSTAPEPLCALLRRYAGAREEPLDRPKRTPLRLAALQARSY